MSVKSTDLSGSGGCIIKALACVRHIWDAPAPHSNEAGKLGRRDWPVTSHAEALWRHLQAVPTLSEQETWFKARTGFRCPREAGGHW